MVVQLTQEQKDAGWQVKKLGEIFEVKHGFAFKGENFSEDISLPIVVTPGNFAIGGGYKEAKPKNYVGEYPAEYQFGPGDFMVTMTDLSKMGDTLGNPAKVPADGRSYLHNQRIGKVIFHGNDVNTDFIFFRMMCSDYRQHVLSTASGSTVRHTSPNKIKEFEFLLPPLNEQKRVAEILGSLDDKIEANSGLLDSLDELIRLEYLSSSDSSELKISDVSTEVKDGVSHAEIADNEVYVGLEHLPRRNVWLREWGKGEDVTSSKSRFKRGDILFGKLRPYFHKVVVAPVDGICSTDIIVVRPEPGFETLALQALSSDEVVAHATNASNGTRMPRTKWADLKDLDTSSATGVLETSYADYAMSLILENQRLSATRDLLIRHLIK